MPKGAAPPPGGGSKSTGAWLKTHKQEAALGAGGIVVALALYVRSKKSSGSSSSTTPSTTVTPATVDTSATDAFSGMENQILGIQQALVGLGTKTGTGTGAGGTTPTPPDYSHEVSQGSGFWNQWSTTPIPGAGGGAYTWISNPDQLSAIVSSGQPFFWQDAPGTFAQVTPQTQLAPLTPQFLKTG